MIDWVPPWEPQPLNRCAVRGCRALRKVEIRTVDGPAGPRKFEIARRYCGTHRRSYQVAVNRQGGAVILPFRKETYLANAEH